MFFLAGDGRGRGGLANFEGSQIFGGWGEVVNSGHKFLTLLSEVYCMTIS